MFLGYICIFYKIAKQITGVYAFNHTRVITNVKTKISVLSDFLAHSLPRTTETIRNRLKKNFSSLPTLPYPLPFIYIIIAKKYF